LVAYFAPSLPQASVAAVINDLSPTQNFLLLRPSTLKNLPQTQPSLPNISPPLFNPPTPPEAFIEDLRRLDEDPIVDDGPASAICDSVVRELAAGVEEPAENFSAPPAYVEEPVDEVPVPKDPAIPSFPHPASAVVDNQVSPPPATENSSLLMPSTSAGPSGINLPICRRLKFSDKQRQRAYRNRRIEEIEKEHGMSYEEYREKKGSKRFHCEKSCRVCCLCVERESPLSPGKECDCQKCQDGKENFEPPMIHVEPMREENNGISFNIQ
jgi:hypothetical protein